MDTDGINVFHVADGDAVAGRVAHHLVLDLLPAGDAALDEHLSDTGETKAVLEDLPKLHHAVRDAAAGAAKRIGRAKNDGVADLLRKLHAVLDVLDDLARGNRLPDLLHGLLEHLAVLGLLDGQGRGAEKLYVVAVKESALGKFHAKVQARLSAEGRQDRIGLFLLDDLLQGLDG